MGSTQQENFNKANAQLMGSILELQFVQTRVDRLKGVIEPKNPYKVYNFYIKMKKKYIKMKNLKKESSLKDIIYTLLEG